MDWRHRWTGRTSPTRSRLCIRFRPDDDRTLSARVGVVSSAAVREGSFRLRSRAVALATVVW